MTPPENPETPDTKTEQDVERKSVATDEPVGAPAKDQEPATASTNGVTHEQETTKFEPAQVEAAQQAAASQEATQQIAQKPPQAQVEDTTDTTVGSSTPPPWQRVTSDNLAQQQAESPTVNVPPAGYQAQPVDTSSQATTNFRPVVTGTAAAAAMPGAAFGVPGVNAPPTAAAPSGGRTSVNIGSAAAPRGGAAPTALRRPGRGPRRASLQVKRVDPWSVLKLALVLGFAMFLIWMVAVGVLYGVLQGMGVWGKLNGTYNELVQGGDNSGGDLISVGRVFGIAAVVGLVNVILFSALATVSAFIYNVSADLAGGIEVTLSERE